MRRARVVAPSPGGGGSCVCRTMPRGLRRLFGESITNNNRRRNISGWIDEKTETRGEFGSAVAVCRLRPRRLCKHN